MSGEDDSNPQQPALKYQRCIKGNGRSDKTEEDENCGKQNPSWFSQYAQSSSTWAYLKDMLSRVVSLHQANNNEVMLGANLNDSSEGWQKFNNVSSHSTAKKGIADEDSSKDASGAFPNTNAETALPPLSELSLCTISCSHLPQKLVSSGSNENLCGMENSSNLNLQQPEIDTMLVVSENEAMVRTNHEGNNFTIFEPDKIMKRDDSLSLWDLRKSIEATIFPQNSFDAIAESQESLKNVSKRKLVHAFYSNDEISTMRHGSSGDRLNPSKEENSGEEMVKQPEIENIEFDEPQLKEECSQTGDVLENSSLLQNKARDKRNKFAKRTHHSSRTNKKSLTEKEPLREMLKLKEDNKNSASCKPVSESKSRPSVLNRRSCFDDLDYGIIKTVFTNSAEPLSICDVHPKNQNNSAILAYQNIKAEIPTPFGFYFPENCTDDSPFDHENQSLITTSGSVQQDSDDSVAPDTGDSSEPYGSSTTCSSSPVSFVSDTSQKTENGNYAEDTTSSDSLTSNTSNIKTGGTMRSLARIFRRSSSKQYMPAASFCGYSLDRDYCVDQQTDKIFKSFLKQDGGVSPKIGKTSTRNRQLHFSGRSAITQLRRQVMRKQYSDSIAMYYGQRMRRMRVEKQRSDSVNCPVDRAVLRRQDRIEEEFDPEEINESLTSPGGGSRRGSGRSPLTVTELKEWRRSQD